MAAAAEKKYIDAAALDALLAAHDGDVALLYLYLRRRSGDREQAARELCRTLREIDTAWEKLERMGLLSAARSDAPALPAPADELPQYSASEISRLGREDAGFSAVLDEAAKVMGHSLSANELRVLCGVYEHLALPPEVILELLNYLGEVYREKYGTSRRPGARAVEKEAYVWADMELLTMEQAEEYIHSRRQRKSELGALQSRLGLQGRELSPTERKYLESWLDLGFEEEAIAIAYDRTVTKTGGLKWPYMNKILLSWQKMGLRSPEEIEAKDPVGRGRQSGGRTPEPDKPYDWDALREAIKKV